jgi:hypothetical protein
MNTCEVNTTDSRRLSILDRMSGPTIVLFGRAVERFAAGGR